MRLFVISRVVLFAAVATALASPAVAADPTREAAQKLAGSNAKAAVAAADPSTHTRTFIAILL